jgi:hypothetical protein
MNIFELILIGHLFGDFVFQNKWMVMNKSASNFKCFIHCWIYMWCVGTATMGIIYNWKWFLIIFISHYPIDRWSLADKWLDLINGRSLKDFMEHGHENIPRKPLYFLKTMWGGRDYGMENYHALRGGFTSIVYTVVDNTFHLTLMLIGYYLIK